MKIAQRLIARATTNAVASPVGTTESRRVKLFQPSLRDSPLVPALFPAINRWAIVKMSALRTLLNTLFGLIYHPTYLCKRGAGRFHPYS